MLATLEMFVCQRVIRTEKLDYAANFATLDYVLSIVSGPSTPPLLTSLVKKNFSGLKHTFLSDTPNLYSIRYLPLAYLGIPVHKNVFSSADKWVHFLSQRY